MIKYIRISALLWLILAMPYAVKAQEQKGLLGELWDKIEEKYPGVASKESKVNAAKLKEQALKGERLPQLKGQAQSTYSTYEGTMGAFFPQAGLINVSGSDNLTGASFSPNTYASATLEWELFSFGKMQNKSKAAKSHIDKTQSEKDVYLLSLKRELSHRFLQLLYTESHMVWNNKNLDRLYSVREITSSLARAGVKSPADSLLASSSYNQALGENEKIKGQKHAALIKLLELTGEEEVSIENSISKFLDPNKILKESSKSIQSNHPALNAVEETKKQLEYSGKSQKRAALPSINLLAGYAYRGTGIGKDTEVSGKWKDGFSNTANNALVGIGITWNITDLYTQKKKGNNLVKKAESVDYLYKQHKLAMQADLSATQNKITYQYAEVQRTKDAQEQAASAYGMYLSRYKSGLMDLSTLLQIQQLLEQAENKHIKAAYGYWNLLAVEAALITDFDYLFNNF